MIEQKEVKIKELEEKLSEINQKYTNLSGEFDTLTGEKNTLLSGLAAAQDSAESMISAEEAATKDANLAKLQTEIDHAKSVIDAQSAALSEAQGLTGITKERLSTLLGHLLINPELQQKAQEFLNGDDAAIGPIQKDVCELYEYLGSVLNLQIRKLDSSGLPREAKQDIFTIFKSIPAYDDKKLLSELNTIFQELFVQIAQTTTIPDNLMLKREYPELTRIIGSYSLEGGKPLKIEGRDLDKLIIELNTFGYLSSVYVEPRPGTFFILKKKGFTIPQEFAIHNTTHMTPLVILGIKMIQLMAKLLRVKYQELASRCGVSIHIESVSREPPQTPLEDNDPLVNAKREFDRSVSQLTSTVLIQHIHKYAEVLLDPKSLKDEQVKYFPKKLAYAILLSEYSHNLVKNNPRVSLARMIESRADILDAVIKSHERKPEYSELIRKAREYATI